MLCNSRRRVRYPELSKKELELRVVSRGQLRLGSLVEIPEPLLERSQRLLARLVEKLLVGISRFALVPRVLGEPRVNLGAKSVGNSVVEHCLEICREMN